MNSLVDIFDGMMPLNPFTTGLIGFITAWGLLLWRYRGHHPGLCKNTLLSTQEKLSATEVKVSEMRKTHDGVMNKLSRGQGNLIRQANSFVELGVKVKKQLPKSIVQQSQSDDGAPSLQIVPSDETTE